MKNRILNIIFVVFVLIAASYSGVRAQQIVYSEVEREDNRRINFDIIGKVQGNFLIYKNDRDKNWLSVYDENMKMRKKSQLPYMQEGRILSVDFFNYNNYAYAIYQLRQRNVVFCMAAKLDGEGNLIGEVVELDSTHTGGGSDSGVYTVIASEDKSKLMLFKINTRDKREYQIATYLYNSELEQLKRNKLPMSMEDKKDHLQEFQLDNEGNFMFTKFNRVNNENIGDAYFVLKEAMADSFQVVQLNTGKILLDEIRIKPDNFNKRIFVTSFYFERKRGNVMGFYMYIWDKQSQSVVREGVSPFTDEFRREAKGNAGVKSAFDDHFLRDIILRKDGGVLLISEAAYVTSRGGAWDRWGYMGNRFMMSPMDYYFYSPYGYNGFYGNRWGGNNMNRYQADNIAVLSFDPNGQQEWAGVVNKEQFDDQSDNLISYSVMNTGGKLHFIFNGLERRRMILTDYTLDPDGEINRTPTLKNLERGYEFMPKFARQVGARQMIIPTVYKNYISFAKVEF